MCRYKWEVVSLLCLLVLLAQYHLVYAEVTPKLKLLPEMNFGFSLGRLGANNAGYAWRYRRMVLIDLLRHRRYTLSLDYEEDTYFGSSKAGDDEPQQMRDRLRYANISYELPRGNLYLFYHHTCSSGLNREEDLSNRLQWDTVAVGYETHGMRLGYINYGINFPASVDFEILNNFQWRAWLGKVVYRTHGSEYEWEAEAALRYDLLRYKNLIPYLQSRLYLTYDDEFKPNQFYELGLRLHFLSVDFIPFVEYSYQYDIDEFDGDTGDFTLYGFKLTTNSQWLSHLYSLALPKGLELFPEAHFKGYYAGFISSRNFNANGKTTLYFDLARLKDKTIFLEIDTEIITKAEGLSPRFMIYTVKSGLEKEFNSKAVGVVYTQSGRYDGNLFDGYTERYGQLGLQLRSQGFKIGHQNDGIDFKTDSGFRWLNKLEWKLAAGKLIYTRNYDYDWNVFCELRWDILRYGIIVPNLGGRVNLLFGHHNRQEYAVEPAVRFHGKGDFSLFFRYEHKVDVDRFDGFTEDQMLFGIMFEY